MLMLKPFFISVTELFHIRNARSVANNEENDGNRKKYDESHNGIINKIKWPESHFMIGLIAYFFLRYFMLSKQTAAMMMIPLKRYWIFTSKPRKVKQ